jgi:hypothetical protein
MARILSYPFRLLPSGAIATVEQTSDAGNAEQIAVLCLTRPGERPLVPAFGIEDPTFGDLAIADLVAGLQMYGPDVEVTAIDSRHVVEGTLEVDIAFS